MHRCLRVALGPQRPLQDQAQRQHHGNGAWSLGLPCLSAVRCSLHQAAGWSAALQEGASAGRVQLDRKGFLEKAVELSTCAIVHRNPFPCYTKHPERQ